jgi:hypothetical protein
MCVKTKNQIKADKPTSSNTYQTYHFSVDRNMSNLHPSGPLDQLEASCFLDSSSIMLLILKFADGIESMKFSQGCPSSITSTNGKAKYLRRDVPPRLHGLLFLLLSSPERPLGHPWLQATPSSHNVATSDTCQPPAALTHYG